MALRVEAHGLLARENEPHGPPRHAGEESRLRLDRQVLLAAEGAAVRDEDDVDVVLGEREERRDLPAVVEDALPLRVEREPGARALAGGIARYGDAGLRLEVQVFDALRPPRSLDDVRRGRERRLGVAAYDDRAREEVALRAHAGRSRTQRLLGIGHGRQDRVVDVDEGRGGAGRARVHGRHRGEHVADAVRLLSFGHEARPVRDDEAVEPLSRHVLRGHDREHARVARRTRRVDPQDAGARVGRERDGAVEHSGKREIRHERAHAERERAGVDSLEARPDASGFVRRIERLSAAQTRRGVEGVHDPDVPRAAAEVRIEPPADLLVRRVRVRVEDALHPQDDSRDAEAALQTRRPRERLGVLERSSPDTPSSVRTFFPAAARAGTAQDIFGWPSTSTRHAPHWPCGAQPSLGDVRPAWSRSNSRSEASGETSNFRAAPLSVNSTDTTEHFRHPGGRGAMMQAHVCSGA